MAETLENIIVNVNGSSQQFDNPMIAELFDTTASYSAGEYCTYQGQTYLFTASKSAGAWDGTKATSVTLANNMLLTYTTMITNASRLSALTGGTNSADDFPLNSIVSIGTQASNIGLTDGAEINGNSAGLYLTLNYTKSGQSGAKQLFINPYGMATRSYTSGAWTAWIVYQGDAYADGLAAEIRGEYLSRYATMITNASRLSDITGGTNSADDFPANKIIYYSNAAPAATNGAEYNGNKGGYYITLAYGGTVGSGSMQVFFSSLGVIGTRLNSAGTWGPWHYTSESVYNVGPTRTYTTLTDFWLDHKTDTSEKIVYVDPGTYDVFAEYQAAVTAGKLTPPPDGTSTSSYKNYCVNIPSNTQLIGLGRVVLEWEPAAADISDTESQIWSPVNVHGGNVHIENITVTCKNGRYCIHDDPHNEFPGANNTYKNVVCVKKANDTGKGFSMVQGMGYCDRGRYEFENCRWFNEITSGSSSYCIGGHEGATGSSAVYEDGATVVFKNCVMSASTANAMRFQTINATGATQRITVDIDSCWLSGGIWLDQYSASSGQFFDLTLLNSGSPVFTIDIGEDNPFPPKVLQAWYPLTEISSISAVYTQSGTVYDTDTLDSLKSDLVVSATYADGSTVKVPRYTLSGTLAAPTSTVTVSYGGKTATFSVSVTSA